MVTHDAYLVVKIRMSRKTHDCLKILISWVSGSSPDFRSFLSAQFVKVNQNSQRLSRDVCWKKVKIAILLWRCSAISTKLHVLILRVDCHCHGSLAQYVKSVRWPHEIITYLHHFATNLNHFITTIGIDYWGCRNSVLSRNSEPVPRKKPQTLDTLEMWASCKSS